MDPDIIMHVATFLSILLPLGMFLLIFRKSKGEFTNAFLGLLLGFFPLALYHFFEALHNFGIDILPRECTFAHDVILHTVTTIAFVTLGLFFWWFHAKYVLPFYSNVKGEKKKK